MEERYIVVCSPNLVAFEEQVNKLIAEGYIPVGGVAVVIVEDDEAGYYQAMVHKDVTH